MKKLLFISLLLLSGSLFAIPAYSWVTGSWGTCSEVCGGGIQNRIVACEHYEGAIVDDSNCSYSPKPAESQACNTNPCTYEWLTGAWSKCSVTCGTGTKTRDVSCKKVESDTIVADENCALGEKPVLEEVCILDPCTVDEDVVDEDMVDEDVVDEDMVDEDMVDEYLPCEANSDPDIIVDEDATDEELIDENDEMPLIDANETPDEAEVKDEIQTPDETETPDESQNNDNSVASDDEPIVDEVMNDADVTEEKDKSDGCSCLII